MNTQNYDRTTYAYQVTKTVKYVLLGAGGHARSLIDVLVQKKVSIDYLVGVDTKGFFTHFEGIIHLCNDEEILDYHRDEIRLINGIGLKPFRSNRREVIEFFEARKYKFETIIAETSILSPFIEIADGCQIMHSVVVNNSSKVGRHTIVNTGSIIEHDVDIGGYSFIGPGTTLCGEVQVGENVFIGAGAVIFPGIKIEHNAVISGGSVVKRDVYSHEVVK